MGCLVSTPKDSGENRRRPGNVGEVAVFVPGLRIPKPVDFFQPLGNSLAKSLVERLSALRTRIVVMAGQESLMGTKPRRTATQHGGSTLADLQQALEDYLPVLLGLVKDGSQLQHKVHFAWVNQEDDTEETAISNSWYEVLSVLHLMALLSLSQANILLIPKTSADGYQPKVLEGPPLIPVTVALTVWERALPVDLAEGVLRGLCLQALGQALCNSDYIVRTLQPQFIPALCTLVPITSKYISEPAMLHQSFTLHVPLVWILSDGKHKKRIWGDEGLLAMVSMAMRWVQNK
ncbi:hypothetical protein HHK36_031921 [Tetracentron sinense]|uniref:Uncharacterized protein n=1 Tax=Tetracentron sinense TaxID=13715 RepID=A0A834Y639_TETSI|nr:hypothetical protein HHK36_031921 [Tetracentron sinense]